MLLLTDWPEAGAERTAAEAGAAVARSAVEAKGSMRTEDGV